MLASSRARAAILLIAVFVAGMLAGAASFRFLPRRFFRFETGPVERDRIPTPLVQLGLTQQETEHLRTIAMRWRPKAGRELETLRAHVSELENGMFAEMLCALTQDKRDAYLRQLEANHFPEEIIAKRFALVRANRCGEVQ